jgi:hypothetical protein
MNLFLFLSSSAATISNHAGIINHLINQAASSPVLLQISVSIGNGLVVSS